MSIPAGYIDRDSRKKKKGFKFVNLILIFLVLTIVVGLGSYIYIRSWYSSGINQKDTESTEIVTLEIPAGSSSQQIGELLQKEGLIDDTNLWNVYTRINNPVFLAAEFKIPSSMSLVEIADLLQQEPEIDTIWVTFPEGRTRKQYVTILQENQAQFTEGNFTATQFDDITEFPDNYSFSEEVQNFLDTYKPEGRSLEGFLYPETYAFEPDFTSQEVVEVMISQLMTRVEELIVETEDRTFYETLTLASVVEKESLNETDRPNVASVFSNRLDIGMKLESDATVNYATGKSERRPTYEDIQISSPYNTYVNVGLPPGPINNPRIESIRHSLNPPQTEYYFFIHEIDGTAHFGRNFQEHSNNVCKYLDKTC